MKEFIDTILRFIVAVCLTAGSFVMSEAAVPGAPEAPPDTSALTVSLITCYPGAEVYALCGHSAIRIRTAQTDSVWNYGIFDFDRPNFIYHFVRGETDYRLASYPFQYFLPEYINRGSRVVEQDLNLTQEEARRLQRLLQTEALPQNAVYRYNYVRDNCATRPVARIDQAVGEKIVYPDSASYGSFRAEMRKYHSNYPWYQFGIDLVLGSGLDTELSGREEMFVPVELMKRAENARFPDGRPLVRETRELAPDSGHAILPPTPWWQTPDFWSLVAFALVLAVTIADIIRGRNFILLYSFWFLLVGAAGFVIWSLVLFSSHEATSPNLLMWSFNPLMLLAAVTLWVRRWAPLNNVLMWIEGVATLIVLLFWPFQPQAANPATFPLLGATLLLSVAYAINYAKGSYKNSARRSSAGSRAPARKPAPKRAPRTRKSQK